jgi:hypothetical protein
MSTGYTGALAAEHDDVPPMRPLTERDHPNAHRLYAAHNAFKAGDVDALFSLMADDVVWHMPGDNSLAGSYHGKDEILRNFAMLQAAVDAYWAHRSITSPRTITRCWWRWCARARASARWTRAR